MGTSTSVASLAPVRRSRPIRALRPLWALVPLAAVVACSAAGDDAGGTTDPTVEGVDAGAGTTVAPGGEQSSGAPAGPSAYTGPGPYPVGTVDLLSPNGPISVWYPAEPGSDQGAAPATYDIRTLLPAADQATLAGADQMVHTTAAYPNLPAAETTQPFPLVLFSHGFCGYRQQSSFLTTAIASWGFVVAAPEHAARDLTACLAGTIGQGASTDVDDLRAAIPQMEGENLSEGGPLATIIDTSRVAVVGHSAGGDAAIAMSADPNVATYVALAAGGGATPAAKPALYIEGDADKVVPLASVEQWWNASVPSPKQLAVLSGVTHLGFMDACTIAPGDGGPFQLAVSAGAVVPDVIGRLYADGCDPKYTSAEEAWPAIRHLTIAQLRAVFGIDPAPVALDGSVADAYPGLTVRYEAA
jgi:dienelactone hydrolase